MPENTEYGLFDSDSLKTVWTRFVGPHWGKKNGCCPWSCLKNGREIQTRGPITSCHPCLDTDETGTTLTLTQPISLC